MIDAAVHRFCINSKIANTKACAAARGRHRLHIRPLAARNGALGAPTPLTLRLAPPPGLRSCRQQQKQPSPWKRRPLRCSGVRALPVLRKLSCNSAASNQATLWQFLFTCDILFLHFRRVRHWPLKVEWGERPRTQGTVMLPRGDKSDTRPPEGILMHIP